MHIRLKHRSLSELAHAEVTYAEVGATAGVLPAGYHHVVRRSDIGHGRDVFERCSLALMTWEVHRTAGLDVRASHSPAQRGAVVSQLIGVRGVGVVAPCKVVYVVDEPGRRGFAYGTLPGHPETGEEAFVVSLQNSDSVVLEITAFIRPASLVGRLGGPVARVVQDRILGRYVAAARRIAKGAGTAG